ncbi:MAG: M20/M25/M40 family metallo-hydrolase [Myxococcales bacterium]|nr:M20/M25/M40 family metallo-hydrolase [Myxococcota bacterium]MDW8283467.1 M20/M25/M40 family metallo-hydrolase [Myxococcales bacterium]
MTARGAAALLLPLLPWLLAADDGVPARLIGEVLSGQGPYAIVRELCDTVGPRLAGSPGAARAEAWALQALRRAGLVQVRAEPVSVPRWERGPRGGERLQVLSPYPHELPVAALGGSVGTPAAGVSGELLVLHDLAELEALPRERVAGRIVLWNAPMRPGPDGMAPYSTVVPLRTRGAAAAARKGAVASLIRSLGTSRARLLHTGSQGSGDDLPPIPAAAVTAEDADLLVRLGQSGPVRLRLHLPCRRLPDGKGHNIVGEVPGRSRPEEIVLVGAHLDSWDLGQGAVDDGAGVALAIAAARAIARQGAARTLRVVLFANEENGLRGAHGYAAMHAAELPRHVAALEVDSGAGRPLGFLVSSEQARRHLAPLVAPLQALGAATVQVGRPGGADLTPIQHQVPIVQMLQDTSRYFEWHHSPADTLDKIDPLELALAGAALAVALHGLLDAEQTLPRP